MQANKRLFLTINETHDAIRMAFVQYPSQLNLLAVLWPMVFGGGAYVLLDPHHRTPWAKSSIQAKLAPASEPDLKQRILHRLKRSPPEPECLARICSLVFGAPATAGSDPATATASGIWIDTDMAGFACTRCGRCCLTLNYHDGCSLADYQRWQELGRSDILDWVGTIRQDGRVTACRIWIKPGTNQFAETCPWLEKPPDRDRYACHIHEVRPTICRQYPGTRKHARMTGCRGV